MLNKRQCDALKYMGKHKMPADGEGHKKPFQKTLFPETCKELYGLGCPACSEVGFGAGRGFNWQAAATI